LFAVQFPQYVHNPNALAVIWAAWLSARIIQKGFNDSMDKYIKLIFFFLRLAHHEPMKTGRSLFIRTNKGALSSGRASSKIQFIVTDRKIQLGDNYHFGNEYRFQPKFIFYFFPVQNQCT
jgi:hypothetical protein